MSTDTTTAPAVPVEQWAAAKYSPAPRPRLVRAWCRDGDIYPPPERVGRRWYVRPDARRIAEIEPPAGRLVDRLRAAR